MFFRILLDARNNAVCVALNVFSDRTGLTFVPFPEEKRGRSVSDSEVVAMCKEQGIDALVSFNHRDFGKKKALYRDLMTAGVSVVVLRPPDKPAFTPERQVSLIMQHTRCIETHLTETHLVGPILLRLSATECRQRTIEEIESEFTDRERRLP